MSALRGGRCFSRWVERDLVAGSIVLTPKKGKSELRERPSAVNQLGRERGRGDLRGRDGVPRGSPCLLSFGRGVGTSLTRESPRPRDLAAPEHVIGRVGSVICAMALLNTCCEGVRFDGAGGRSQFISCQPQVLQRRGH